MSYLAFILISPEHHCVPDDGYTVSQQIPVIDGKYSECEMYNMSSTSWPKETMPCRHGWYFNDSDIGKTIVSDFQLVCGVRATFPEFSGSVRGLGMLIFGFLMGPLADRYGRKRTLIALCFSFGLTLTIQAFLPEIITFMLFQFFAGACAQGMIVINFTYSVEWLPGDYRPYASFANSILWFIGLMSLSLKAYLIRNWSYLTLSVGIPAFLIAIALMALPESFNWVMAKRKRDEAEAILERLSRWNRVDLQEIKGKNWDARFEKKDENEVKESIQSPFAVFRYRFLIGRVVIGAYVWFACAIVYYGLMFSSVEWGGNRYENFALAGVVEVPSSTLGFLLLK